VPRRAVPGGRRARSFASNRRDRRAVLARESPLRPISTPERAGRHVRPAGCGGRAATLLGNDDVEIAWVAADTTSMLYRDATGDELVYVHQGTPYLKACRRLVARRAIRGHPGRYDAPMVLDSPVEMLIIAARGHVSVPARYLNAHVSCSKARRTANVISKRLSRTLSSTAGTCRCSCAAPRAQCSMSRRRIRSTSSAGRLPLPVVMTSTTSSPSSGAHQPPPVPPDVRGADFVVCSSCRAIRFDPNAVKVPYHHSNVDSDEVLFYAVATSEPGRVGHRRGIDQLASARLRARPAAG